jgi:hypothetical protein
VNLAVTPSGATGRSAFEASLQGNAALKNYPNLRFQRRIPVGECSPQKLSEFALSAQDSCRLSGKPFLKGFPIAFPRLL